MSKRLLQYAGYVFDLDGCLHFGNTPAPGAGELISFLRERGKTIRFLSNNSTHSPAHLAAKLWNMGIITDGDELHLASTLLGQRLKEIMGETFVAVAGSQALANQLGKCGHTITPLEQNTADCLVVGRDLGFSYERLVLCVQHIERGALFYATNEDTYHPTAKGRRVPETGAFTAAISAVTGVFPITTGKPTSFAFEHVLQELALHPSDCLMVGDNPRTDIAGAVAAGMDACWINLAPEADTADALTQDMDTRCTFTFSSIAALLDAMQQEIAAYSSPVS